MTVNSIADAKVPAAVWLAGGFFVRCVLTRVIAYRTVSDACVSNRCRFVSSFPTTPYFSQVAIPSR